MQSHDLPAAIARLRAQGTDDDHYEVKACAAGLGKSVWDSVSAFANTNGGTLILGLDEKTNFSPASGFDLDRVRDQFVDGIGDGGKESLLLNPPAYSMSRAELSGRPVLLIEVVENNAGTKPCAVRAKGLENGSYKRVDDKDIRLSITEIFEFRNALLPQESDRTIVMEADLDDLDPTLIDAVFRRMANTRSLRGADSAESKLTRLSAVNKRGEVRLAGLLALGLYPQQFVPRLFIDVTVHPANEKSLPRPVRFIDRVACDGPLPEAIDRSVDVVARNLRTYSVMEGAARHDELEIPLEVLREAVANAAVHREYQELFRGQPVTIDVFPDRVVVTSPGGLWGGKTVDNIADGTSRCRNQTLMQLLQHVPFSSGYGPTVEGQGGGVLLMINRMEAHALDRPEFRIGPDQVSVTLRRHGAEVPEHRARIRQLAKRTLTHHEDAALIMTKRQGSISSQELHEILRIDSDEARILLAQLAAEGLLRSLGDHRYGLGNGTSDRGRSSTRANLLAALSVSDPRDINELAAELGTTPNTLRPLVRQLVHDGLVTATAPVTSRHRKYLRSRSKS